jgi:Icc-related predicted phosphoesterase
VLLSRVESRVSEELEPLSRRVQIAAAGDLHVHEADAGRWHEIFRSLAGVDLILLAGDLTADGLASQAELLAAACGEASAPVAAVLGNHDWHMGEEEGIATALRTRGVRVLERESTVYPVRGVDIGVAGLKGFVGGFLDSRIPDFGEPLLRRLYAQTSLDVDALERELQAIEDCDVRVVLLHYSPTATTLDGEREGIWAFLGTDRLAEPILRHEPELVVHGHAHGGAAHGCIGPVDVWNVAAPLLGWELKVFELDVRSSSGGDGRLEAPPQHHGGAVDPALDFDRAHQ